jgi:hypothetical protein
MDAPGDRGPVELPDECDHADGGRPLIRFVARDSFGAGASARDDRFVTDARGANVSGVDNSCAIGLAGAVVLGSWELIGVARSRCLAWIAPDLAR